MGMTLTLEQHFNDQDMNDHAGVGSRADAPNLLLMRMQVLQLDARELMRIEAGVFGYLAEACASCTNKGICAQDLAAATTITHDWETYCSNAAILRAVAALPWFAKAGSRSNFPTPTRTWRYTT
jgi:hypothetical protein